MSDPISKLRGLTSEIKGKEQELRSYFADLTGRIEDASGGYSANGQSESCLLEEYGDDPRPNRERGDWWRSIASGFLQRSR